ncbi:tripartite tricarboxylate transporter substrate binding protein [Ancylobacter sp. Lp-2]|uniref:Bug family tripartite tricarboxylate transporter substrate binding protein n=1 Tax=Ancylobacter sp. Lp-2 TaxID=2881339 RepID=UPI001E4CD361|nr:tripartite tricarboxylate transporter substrate-binding protein [Ancylobacter sp. Lp-2]MCB4769587.1 tripartite tricarboxylate transporter substrate binding protein [Ancylobacter sp. Lp-2]
MIRSMQRSAPSRFASFGHAVRRGIGGAVLVAGLASAGIAQAQQTTVTIPASPGGGWDNTARMTMQVLQKEKLVSGGIQFVNKGGGVGIIGLTDFVRNNKGNDNALMFMGVIMLSSILTNRSAITMDDVAPLARLTREYNAVAVPTDSPIKTPADLVAELKKDPGAFAVGGSGVGTVDHLTMALIAKTQGIPANKLNFIAFSGGEIVPALVGGKIKAAVSGLSELYPLAQAGRIRLIAVTSDNRLPGVDIPTLKEAGLDVSVSNWRGVVGAPGMSAAARKEWIGRFETMAKSPEWAAALEKQGMENAYLGGEAFSAFIASENQNWQGLLKEAGLVN